MEEAINGVASLTLLCLISVNNTFSKSATLLGFDIY